MAMTKTRTYGLLISALLSVSSLAAETRISLTRTAAVTVQIGLSNDRQVAAFQFTVIAEGLSVDDVIPGSRLSATSWQFFYHRTSESTVNVIAYRSGIENLSVGEGAIAEMTLRGMSGTIRLSRVVISDPQAVGIPVLVTELEWNSVEEQFAQLGQNYPNPFNPATTIPYSLEREAEVTLVVYDMAGREIKRVAEGQKQTGSHAAVWNGDDELGFRVASGTYLIQLRAGTIVQTRKMILTR
jgi:hypothetical protein